MKRLAWRPIWVGDMPSRMREGELYISVKHRLTEHLCACGCGEEISLPLGRCDWRIVFDGETISLSPSVGNWRLPCGSHYIIHENATKWCRPWSQSDVIRNRKRDQAEKLKEIAKRRPRMRWLRWVGRTLSALLRGR